jgi:hypothetical protein
VPASGPYQGFFEDAPYGYQCVELANRFVFDLWGLAPINANGNNYASTLSSARHVPLVANGTAGQPYLPGDVVSFTGTGALRDGHVAVVMGSTYTPGDGGNYSVTLLEENASASGTNTATVTNWKMANPKGALVTPSNFDALASRGVQMILDGAGQVWAKSTIGYGAWTQETPAGEKAISAGDGVQMILDGAGQVWAKSTIGYGAWTQETPAGEKKVSAG